MLRKCLHITRQGLKESRRAIHALRASPLEELGLAQAITHLAEGAAEKANLQLDLQIPDRPLTLPPEIEQAVYRVAEEALRNVVRHASAQTLTVRLEECDQQTIFGIEDDGVGFEQGASRGAGRYGLQGMQERAHGIGAHLDIDSQPGRGTFVQLRWGGLHDPGAHL
jgi:signal transduction histidine kinase